MLGMASFVNALRVLFRLVLFMKFIIRFSTYFLSLLQFFSFRQGLINSSRIKPLLSPFVFAQIYKFGPSLVHL